jgi:hypothetical protein
MSTMPQNFGNDPYGLIASGLPPELAAQARGLTREQAIAEALLAQSQKPMETNRMAGGYVIRNSPLEGIAKIAQAYAAHQGLKNADKKFADLSTQYQTGQSNAMADYIKTRQGDPGRAPVLDPQESEQMADQGSPMPPNVGAVPGNPRAAIQAAMMNPYLQRNPMVAADLSQLNKPPEKIDLGDRWKVTYGDGRVVYEPKAATPDATVRAETAGKDRDARAKNIPENWKSALPAGAALDPKDPPGVFRMRGADGQIDVYTARFEGGNLTGYQKLDNAPKAPNVRVNVPAPITPVTIQDPDNPNATIIIDGRTRQVLGKGPKLTETGRSEHKRQFAMQGFSEIVAEAERILNDKAKPPTGSGAGALWDTAAGFVGVTPSGAAEAQDLKAIGAALVAKMPRMEGPQSDKDVKLYKEAAAEIGDPTIPVERRVKALGTVKRLNTQYERRTTTPDRRAPGNVVDFNSLPPGR